MAPNDESFKAAVASFRAEMDPKNVEDPQDADSYPILTLSWLVIRKDLADKAKLKALREVVRYCLTDGQTISTKLGYIPLSKAVIETILKHKEWFSKTPNKSSSVKYHKSRIAVFWRPSRHKQLWNLVKN